MLARKRSAWRHALGVVAIAPHWLGGQYLTRQRSYTSIAAALGARTETAIAAAREAEACS